MGDETTTTDAAAAAAAAAATAATTTDGEPKTYDEKYVKGLRDENAKARVALNEFKSKTETERKAIAKALGLGEDGTPDPAKLQEALSAKDAEVRQLRAEGRVRSLSAKAGADADALLDSRSFVATLASLDPTAASFGADVAAAIKAAVDGNSKLKIAQVATKGGSEIKPGTDPAGKTFSRAQLRDTAFYQANEKEILEALANGRITG